jgi:hypothetical protein
VWSYNADFIKALIVIEIKKKSYTHVYFYLTKLQNESGSALSTIFQLYRGVNPTVG